MNYLSIGGKSVIKNDQSKLTRWDVIIYDMEVPGKPFKDYVIMALPINLISDNVGTTFSI